MEEIDKNISKLFVGFEENAHIDLEDSVMDKLQSQREYETLLSKARERTKIGIVISVVFLVAYFVLTGYTSLKGQKGQMELLELYLPSLNAAILIIITYLILIFGSYRSKNETGKIEIT